MSVDWLAGELTTMALCWRLDRADGVTIGFTAHDRDLVIAGVIYRASPGMLPSAIRQSSGFDVDTLDIEGALTGDAITADDLMAGRWDGAALTLFAADWSDPVAPTLSATMPSPPSCAGRPRCSKGRWSSRPRPIAAPRWETGAAVSISRRARGGRGSSRWRTRC